MASSSAPVPSHLVPIYFDAKTYQADYKAVAEHNSMQVVGDTHRPAKYPVAIDYLCTRDGTSLDHYTLMLEDEIDAILFGTPITQAFTPTSNRDLLFNGTSG